MHNLQANRRQTFYHTSKEAKVEKLADDWSRARVDAIVVTKTLPIFLNYIFAHSSHRNMQIWFAGAFHLVRFLFASILPAFTPDSINRFRFTSTVCIIVVISVFYVKQNVLS
jgi:hypothetical protein